MLSTVEDANGAEDVFLTWVHHGYSDSLVGCPFKQPGTEQRACR